MTHDEDRTKSLTPEQYHVTQEKGTERAFTGKYWDTKTPGTYACVVCGQELFSSDTKYDSGSGWPSFSQPTDPTRVSMETDRSHGMKRTEVTCSRCGAHLGHVFDDGPRPTGLRYCINSASLDLEAKAEAEASSAEQPAEQPAEQAAVRPAEPSAAHTQKRGS